MEWKTERWNSLPKVLVLIALIQFLLILKPVLFGTILITASIYMVILFQVPN